MTWNDMWVTTWTETEKKFPDIVFELEKHESVWVYTHLKYIKFPIEGVVATQEALQIPVGEIKRLAPEPGGFEGVDGATKLPVVSERAANLLQTPPEGSCTFNEGVADVYWVSYNKSVTKAQIDCLCAKQAEKLTDCAIDAQIPDVFDLYFFFD